MQQSVLIVGAGPTGLTAAVELARQNMAVKLVEKRQSGSGLSRAVGITPASLDILAASGASARLIGEGIRFQTVHIYNGRRALQTIPLNPSNPSGHEFILGLAQDRTEAILRARLADFGGAVSYGTELKGLAQDADGVTAHFADGTNSRHSYVIGADGVHSTVRSALGLEFAGMELADDWSIADVNAKNWPHPEAFTAFLLAEGGVAIVVPLAIGRFRVIANRPGALAQLPLRMEVTTIHREGDFRISVRQVKDYQKGRVFLAGDAAHSHSPVGGRGMNLGIADAADIAHRIMAHDTAGYGAGRRREGAKIIAASERARQFITAKSPLVRALFKLVVTLVGVTPPLRRRAVAMLLRG